MPAYTVTMRLQADDTDALTDRLDLLEFGDGEWVSAMSEVPAFVPVPPHLQQPPPQPAPAVRRLDSVEPTEGPAAGGTEITLTGVGFTNIGGVRFEGGGQQGWAWSYEVVDDNTITCPTPPMPAGVVDVIAFDGDPGDAVLSGGFTYT